MIKQKRKEEKARERVFNFFAQDLEVVQNFWTCTFPQLESKNCSETVHRELEGKIVARRDGIDTNLQNY